MPIDPFPDFDVAIAGAGLAGASLALWLSRDGARVALLDSGEFPRDKLCGEYLSPECWGVLERMGVAGDVSNSAYHPIRRIRITTPRGRVIESEIATLDERPGIGLSRSFLDDLIVRRAREAGAMVLERSRVGGPLLRHGRVVGLHARHQLHGPFEVKAKVTIAADGRHSALVRQTGRTRGRSPFRPRLFGMKRHLNLGNSGATEPFGTVGLNIVPGGYGGTCSVGAGVTNLCALLPESDVRHLRGDLDRVARETLGRNPSLAALLEASTPAGEWKTVSNIRVEVSRPGIDGILYAGDCQGTIDPLGGQGMTMALLGAEQLARAVESALVSTAGADRSVQTACQTAWHHRFDGRIRLCRLFHHALVHPEVVDLISLAGSLASRAVSACYRKTRDPSWAGG
ncbi:MAG: flavin-dependent dehydrogenase [Planctomycetota bacterium]|nr:flavin-dependent dehydrogenase [Planctomycetota bacterium]